MSDKYQSLAIAAFCFSFFGFLSIVCLTPSDDTKVKITRTKVIEEAIKHGRSIDEIQKLKELMEK